MSQTDKAEPVAPRRRPPPGQSFATATASSLTATRGRDTSAKSGPPSSPAVRRQPASLAASLGNDSPSQGYEVGYGKPPKKHQFKTGQVPNPNGRRGKSRATEDESLLEEILAELGQSINVTEGSKSKRMRKMRAFAKSLIARALKGDSQATKQLIGLLSNPALRRMVSASAEPEHAELSLADEDIIEQFRQQCIEQYRLESGGK